jgi:hypothetical protein
MLGKETVYARIMEVDGTVSRSCPIPGFGVIIVELSGSANSAGSVCS